MAQDDARINGLVARYSASIRLQIGSLIQEDGGEIDVGIPVVACIDAATALLRLSGTAITELDAVQRLKTAIDAIEAKLR